MGLVSHRQQWRRDVGGRPSDRARSGRDVRPGSSSLGWNVGRGRAGLRHAHASRAALGRFAHPMVGDWKSVRDPRTRAWQDDGWLHVAQSTDGRFTAWMDAWFIPNSTIVRSVTFGMLLEPTSLRADGITLTRTAATALPLQYDGHVTDDGARLVGEWESLPGGPLSSLPRSLSARAADCVRPSCEP